MRFITRLVIWVCITAILLTLLSLDCEAANPYDVTINPEAGTSIDVSEDPGVRVKFNLRVENRGTEDDTFDITNSTVPEGWTVSINPMSLTLRDGDEEIVVVSVTSPDDAGEDEEATICITATSTEDPDDPPANETVCLEYFVDHVYDISVELADGEKNARTGEVGDTHTFQVNVTNQGNGEDSILMDLYADGPDWKPSWGSIVSSIELQRDESRILSLVVQVPNDANVGTYRIGIRGTSDDDPFPEPVNARTDITVHVNQTYDVIVSIPAPLRTADVDQQIEYGVEIRNQGNGNDTISLMVTDYPDGWGVAFNESLLELGPKETTQVSMLVQTPTSEEPHGYFINFTATSENAPDRYPVVKIGSTITTINQTYEFGIIPEPDYASVQPGETVEFEISLENQGTGNDHIMIGGSGDFPDSWIVSIASNVSLARDQTVVRTLTVFIGNETPMGEFRITLTGTSDDDPHIPAFPRQVEITINVEQKFNLATSISVDTRSIDPFPQSEVHTVSYEFTVNNSGTGRDTFEFSSMFDATPARKSGWSVAFVPETIYLGAREEGKVSAIVTVPYREIIDTYGLTIISISQGDGSLTGDVRVFIEVYQTYAFEVHSEQDVGTVIPGGWATFNLSFENLGTVDDSYRAIAEEGILENWGVAGTGSVFVAHGQMENGTLGIVTNLETPVGEYPLIFTYSSVRDPTTPPVSLALNIKVVPRQNFPIKPIANIISISPNPAYSGQDVNFTSVDEWNGFIVRFVWTSSIDGELYNGSDISFERSGLSIGTHDISLRVEATNGAWSNPVNVEVLVHERPIVTGLTVSSTSIFVGDPFLSQANAKDDGQITRYEWTSSIDGVLYSGPDLVVSMTGLSMGIHTISVRVQDGHGVWSRNVSTDIVVLPKNIPPEINEESILVEEVTTDVYEIFHISGSATDEDGEVQSIEYSIDGGPWNSATGAADWNFTWDTRGFEMGNHTVRIRSDDGTDHSEIHSLGIVIRGEEERTDKCGGGSGGVVFLILSMALLGLFGTLGVWVKYFGGKHSN